MKKGQAAMEFLMTYGWAILVVLAAIGALAYFGVLSPDRFLPSKCQLSPPFSCTEYKVTAGQATDGLQLRIENNGGVDLDSVHISVTGDCTNNTVHGFVGNGDAIDSGLITFNCDTSALSAGGRFKADLSLVYQNTGGAVNHTATGSIQARAEA